MRIRTDGDYQYRKDVIEHAATFYDCNRTKAVVSACDDVTSFYDGLREVLSRDDLTSQQKQEIADAFDTVLSVDVTETVSVERE
jgi:outer membrane receptor for Fe3+-dicitrate